MSRRRGIRLLWICLIGITTAFIWGQSLMNASDSGAESGAVQQWLVLLFGDGFAETFLYVYLRKVAHFSEYAVLGVTWSGWRNARPPLKRAKWLVYFAGILTATCDELLQFIAPGRGPAVTDVLIDTAGYAVGALLWWGLVSLIRRKKNAKK